MLALEIFLAALVFMGALPLIAGAFQYGLASVHCLRRRSHPEGDLYPRVAVVIPAWNEAAVIGRTLDQLARLEYPRERLRIYVVDDASTDATPELLRAKAKQYPGLVWALRREHGGEGKAHTINHGLREICAEGWYQAVMVIDADVIFTTSSLRRMARHLADPKVGAATAYIKEGSRPANYMNRFIAYEYITAQAAARRGLNVLGVQACLAGGAQLIRRESLEAVGGEIDTSTLAEDTVTTFRIQLAGKRVVFEPHATVWAEEPRGVDGLWKQRLRWARGNIQVTRMFSHVWLRPRRKGGGEQAGKGGGGGGGLGRVSFALIWFSVLLMPVFLVCASTGLIALFFIDRAFATHVFKGLWAINVVVYLFITLSSFSIDPSTARRCWLQGIAFPGAVSLLVMLYTVAPTAFVSDGSALLRDLGAHPTATLGTALTLFAYAWLTLAMVAAAAIRQIERRRSLAWLAAPLVYLVGYGPLQCAITATAYIKQLRGAEMRWDKTEKVGAVGELA
jgi:cellulose synthase/poly-beta-1,6-N-acetylglucosamine synthase-like glycosyltransferase